MAEEEGMQINSHGVIAVHVSIEAVHKVEQHLLGISVIFKFLIIQLLFKNEQSNLYREFHEGRPKHRKYQSFFKNETLHLEVCLEEYRYVEGRKPLAEVKVQPHQRFVIYRAQQKTTNQTANGGGSGNYGLNIRIAANYLDDHYQYFLDLEQDRIDVFCLAPRYPFVLHSDVEEPLVEVLPQQDQDDH